MRLGGYCYPLHNTEQQGAQRGPQYKSDRQQFPLSEWLSSQATLQNLSTRGHIVNLKVCHWVSMLRNILENPTQSLFVTLQPRKLDFLKNLECWRTKMVT